MASSGERQWTIAVWFEDGEEREEILPSHWVDEEERIVYWPPKNQPTGQIIAKWLSPSDSWRQYPLKKIRLEKSSKELCDMYILHHDSSLSEIDTNKKVTARPAKKFAIPKKSTPIKKKRKSDELFSSDEESDGPSFIISPHQSSSQPLPHKKHALAQQQQYKTISSQPPMLHRHSQPSHSYTQSSTVSSPHQHQSTSALPSPQQQQPSLSVSSQQQSLSISSQQQQQSISVSSQQQQQSLSISSQQQQQSLSVSPQQPQQQQQARNTRTYDAFVEMDMRRFQYTVLMELESIKEENRQLRQSVNNLGRRTEPENSAFFLRPMTTMDEFNMNEYNLCKPAVRSLTITRLRRIGGRDVRDTLRNAVNAVMKPALQLQFNKKGGGKKDVITGEYLKRAFQPTKLFICITEAMLQMGRGWTQEDIVSNIGEVLKRARN